MKTEKHFRDSIHGYIHVPLCVVSEIIDTPLFQRLQDVEQTGMRPLFPAAKHNRFSHSLGVYKLGKEAVSGFRRNAEEILAKDGRTLGSYEYGLLHEKLIAKSNSSDSHEKHSGPNRVDRSKLNSDWWEKHELLFSLACLLHDCAHAPYSHTYEFFYEIPKTQIDNEFLDKLGIEKEGRESLLKGDIQLLNKALLEECPSKSFVDDYMIFRAPSDGNGLKQVNTTVHKAKEHEKLSAAMIGREYREAIGRILRELLPDNFLVDSELFGDDIEFMVRCVIGMHYKNVPKGASQELSMRNCLISLLNSDMLDVDGLDYMVRDAYNSGVDNGRVDYQRFFGLLTVAPIEVYEDVSFKDQEITGLWLKGSSLMNKSPLKPQGFSIQGKWSMQINIHAQRPENEDVSKDSDHKNDWFTIEDTSKDKVLKGNVIKCNEHPTKMTVKEDGCATFRIECSSAVEAEGKFTGQITGKRVRDINAASHGASENEPEIEYALVYDKACISTIEHAISSRNFEYKWIYSHPKVVYYSSFLLCALMRMSARYLCCKRNPDKMGFDEEGFGLESCNGCDIEKDNEPDFMIPKILGFNTYISDIPCEDVFGGEGDSFADGQQFLFYRSSDSDMRALFKTIMIDNEMRKTGPIPCISKYFNAFFSRNHQKSLWKTYNEYRSIFDDLGGTINDVLESKLLEEGKTSQKDYKILDGTPKDILEKYGIKNPVVVKASLNLKEIDRYNTLIKTTDQEISRFVDIVSDESSSPKSEFFYIYYDPDGSEKPSSGELKQIFKEMAEAFSESIELTETDL